jgi:hypothetical protein
VRPRRTVLMLVLVALATMAGSLARANVPSPSASTVDPCLRVCPAGDMNFHVVVRDFASNPINGSVVTVDLSNCFALTMCPPLGNEPYAFGSPTSLMVMTNAAGVADFPIRAGGACLGTVRISADGVLLALREHVTSPDQNGGGVVDANDQALLALKLTGPFDPDADLNCSAALEAGDTAILNAHLGHACAAVVPVLPKSWGTIKTIYR